jgi:hypothetical protein
MPPKLLSNVITAPIQILPLFVASHLSLSVLLIINSQLLPSQYKLDEDETAEECFDANHHDLVQRFVGDLYSHCNSDNNQ